MSSDPATRLTLGQMRTFLAVASTGSVRAAAEQLVVTQPAVSSALAAVRRQVGVALVMRDGRGLRLTPAGQALYRALKARAVSSIAELLTESTSEDRAALVAGLTALGRGLDARCAQTSAVGPACC